MKPLELRTKEPVKFLFYSAGKISLCAIRFLSDATLEREWFATENKREKKYANKAIVIVSKRYGIEK